MPGRLPRRWKFLAGLPWVDTLTEAEQTSIWNPPGANQNGFAAVQHLEYFLREITEMCPCLLPGMLALHCSILAAQWGAVCASAGPRGQQSSCHGWPQCRGAMGMGKLTPFISYFCPTGWLGRRESEGKTDTSEVFSGCLMVIRSGGRRKIGEKTKRFDCSSGGFSSTWQDSEKAIENLYRNMQWGYSYTFPEEFSPLLDHNKVACIFFFYRMCHLRKSSASGSCRSQGDKVASLLPGDIPWCFCSFSCVLPVEAEL